MIIILKIVAAIILYKLVRIFGAYFIRQTVDSISEYCAKRKWKYKIGEVRIGALCVMVWDNINVYNREYKRAFTILPASVYKRITEK